MMKIRIRGMAFDADKWITVKPNGSQNKGSPVKIGENGEIKAGMGGKFNGQKIGEVHKGFTGAKTPDKATLEANKQSQATVEHSQESNNKTPSNYIEEGKVKAPFHLQEKISEVEKILNAKIKNGDNSEETKKDAASLYRISATIANVSGRNIEKMSEREKQSTIEMLEKIANAEKVIDKYENDTLSESEVMREKVKIGIIDKSIRTTSGNNFKEWKDSADMPMKDENGKWYDAETGLPFEEEKRRIKMGSEVSDYRAFAKQFGGKALQGSTKQKEWAEKIRAQTMTNLRDADASFFTSMPIFEHSKFWIDNRDKTKEEFGAFQVEVEKLRAEGNAQKNEEFYKKWKLI